MSPLTQTQIFWLLLSFLQWSIAGFIFYSYIRDKKSVKIIIGTAFILLSINHVYLGFITSLFQDQIPPLLQNLQIWCFYPGLLALAFSTHQSILNKKTIHHHLTIYFTLVLISLPLVLFNPYTFVSILFIYGLAFEVSIIILFDTIMKKAFSNLILFLAIMFYTIGGVMVFQPNPQLAQFSFFVANMFVITLIAISKPQPKYQESSMTEVFSLRHQLDETKKQLTNQENTFQTLFNEMVDPVMILDHKGIVLETTRRIQDYIGYTREELLHTNILKSSMMTRKAKMLAMANLVKRMSGIHIPPYEITVVKKNGDLLPVEINARRIKYQGKHVDMVVFRDISDRKQMQQDLIESEKKYRELFNNLSEGMAKVDMQGKIIECNPAFEQMLGYKFSELQHLTYTDITPQKWHEKEQDILNQQVFPKGYSEPYKKEYRQKDGTIIPVMLTTYLIQDQKKTPVGLWALVRDISKQQRYEQQIHELNENLELKVKQRTEEVERLLEQKNEFIHLLAHDLKNPMATPLTLLPIVNQKVSDPKVHEIIDITLRNVHRMKQLIDDTLQLAQADENASAINLASINLSVFMNHINEVNQEFLTEHGFQLKHSIPSKINLNGDSFQLEEVMNNLISNAVKYTNDSDERLIHVDAKETRDEIIVTVSDRGQGVAGDKKDKVFEKFYKTGKPRDGMNSTGLGLSLCKTIIENHGGRIWVESKGPGQGSSFSFSLPKQQSYKRSEQGDSRLSSIRKNIDDLLARHQ